MSVMGPSPSGNTADEEEGIFGLSEGEKWWSDQYDLLEKHGYQLRPRFRPGWTPSWRRKKKNPILCEDSHPNLHLKVIDATRVSDKAQVVIKQLTKGSSELRIAQYLSSEDLRKDPRNNCVMILDVFSDEDNDLEFMVMPLLIMFDEPAFSSVDEVVDFIKQTLEGLSFMHSKGVAHRDYSILNIMMDWRPLYPRGFHPGAPDLDAAGKGYAHPLRRRDVRSVRYYFTDFGISSWFEDESKERLVIGKDCQDKELPELYRNEPYNPFLADVFILGNLFKHSFIEEYEDLDFLGRLIDAMTRKEPNARPTINAALQQFNDIVRKESARSLMYNAKSRTLSRMDALSFVLDIPSIVEGFVKTARAIAEYRGIEKHAETLQDAIYYAEKLRYLSHFIDGASLAKVEEASPRPSSREKVGKTDAPLDIPVELRQPDEGMLTLESQRILRELLENATSALDVAQRVVAEWAVRLGLGDSSKSRLLVAKVALSFSDRMVSTTGVPKERRKFSIMKAKIALLALGCVQIQDAMGRLKHWLTELHDILLAPPKLHLHLTTERPDYLKNTSDDDDDLLFVTIARKREQRSLPVQRIESDIFASARPLERDRSDLLLIDAGPFEGCIVDRRDIFHFLEQDKGPQVTNDTERMVRLFAEEHDDLGHNITASVGILPCCGFSSQEPGYHDLVFRLPTNCQRPRSLRTFLLEEPQHTLNERLEFCIKLSSAVLIVHSLGLLHKDIRPDSVLLIEPISLREPIPSSKRLGEPFLVAFNQARLQSSRTVPLSEVERQARSQLWAAIYRHPRHFMTSAYLPFEARDDIFSLGLCLLEIAIWKSLFAWNEEKEVFECDKSVLDISEMKYVEELAENHESKGRVRAALRWRDIVRFAEERIPIAMGTTFKEIVVECLTFGEEKSSMVEMLQRQKDNQEFQQNQSVNFVKRVLSKLRSLKLQ